MKIPATLGELRHCVRQGGALRPLEYWLMKHGGFTEEYIRGMQNIARGPAAEIAKIIDAKKIGSMLDVGAGSGTYSVAFLAANPSVRAMLLDLPSTLRTTRKLIAVDPERTSRIHLQAGDYRRADFGRNQYDLVLLSHVTHDERACRLGLDSSRDGS